MKFFVFPGPAKNVQQKSDQEIFGSIPIPDSVTNEMRSSQLHKKPNPNNWKTVYVEKQTQWVINPVFLTFQSKDDAVVC